MIIKGQGDKGIVSLREEEGFTIRLLEPLYSDFYGIKIHTKEYPQGAILGYYTNDFQVERIMNDLFSNIVGGYNYLMPDDESDEGVIF